MDWILRHVVTERNFVVVLCILAVGFLALLIKRPQKGAVIGFNIFLFVLLAEVLLVAPLLFSGLSKIVPSGLVPTYRYNYMKYWRNILQSEAQYDEEITYVMKPGSHSFKNTEFHTTVDINSLGVRDDESSLEAPEIVLVGDSFGAGWGVENEQTFADIIEKTSGKKLLNASVSSYGTLREMKLLNRIDTSRMTTLIIQYCDNDFAENKRWAHPELAPSSEEEWATEQAKYNATKRYYPGKMLWLTLPKLVRDMKVKMLGGEAPRVASNAEEADLFTKIVAAAPFDHEKVRVIVVELNGNNLNDGAFADALAGLSSNMTIVRPDLESADYYIFDDHINAEGHAKVAEAILANF